MEKMQIQHSNPEGKAFICSRRRALTWFMMIERTGVKLIMPWGSEAGQSTGDNLSGPFKAGLYV